MQNKIIELKNVHKSYRNNNRLLNVLNDINLDVSKGEFISILGPNGCGKTTLLNLIGGFTNPDKGNLLFNGEQINGPDVRKITLFQELGLFDWKNVEDNIKFPLLCQNTSKLEINKRLSSILELIGLREYSNLYPHQLSGGMKQKISIARAIINNPEVLLLDEPFAALDPQTKEFLQEELHSIHLQDNKTILLVTHDIDEAIFLSDKIIVLSSRPAKIKNVFKVNMKKPRDPSVRHSKDFLQLKKSIWNCLREEIQILEVKK